MHPNATEALAFLLKSQTDTSKSAILIPSISIETTAVVKKIYKCIICLNGDCDILMINRAALVNIYIYVHVIHIYCAGASKNALNSKPL